MKTALSAVATTTVLLSFFVIVIPVLIKLFLLWAKFIGL